jgi:hypothetical protein
MFAAAQKALGKNQPKGECQMNDYEMDNYLPEDFGQELPRSMLPRLSSKSTFTPHPHEVKIAREKLVSLFPNLPGVIGNRIDTAVSIVSRYEGVLAIESRQYLVFDFDLNDYHFVDINLHSCTCKDYYSFGQRAPCAHRVAAWLWFSCWSGGSGPKP